MKRGHLVDLYDQLRGEGKSHEEAVAKIVFELGLPLSELPLTDEAVMREALSRYHPSKTSGTINRLNGEGKTMNPDVSSEPHPHLRVVGEQGSHASEPAETGLFSAAEKADYTKALDARTGTRAISDWRVIWLAYKKASAVALKESGAADRVSPVYARRFGQIMLAEGLKQVGGAKGTQNNYRSALLNIADNELAFMDWFTKTNPQVTSPPNLWQAYSETIKPPKKDRPPKPKKQSKTETQLSTTIQKQADIIDKLKTKLAEANGNPAPKPDDEPADDPELQVLTLTIPTDPVGFFHGIADAARGGTITLTIRGSTWLFWEGNGHVPE